MTFPTRAGAPPFAHASFPYALAADFLCINVSEVFRYFAFVMRDDARCLSGRAGCRADEPIRIMIWGLWGTILVLAAAVITWLTLRQCGGTIRIARLAGTAVWIAIFGILRLGLFDMNLAITGILPVALPLACLEMIGATLIV